MEINDHFLSYSDTLLSTTNTCELSMPPSLQDTRFDVPTHEKQSLGIQGHSHRRKLQQILWAAFPTPNSAVGAQGWKESAWGALLHLMAKHPTQPCVCSTGNTQG